MSELFDRFRSTAGKAAFEAEKLRRVNAMQSEIRPLKSEIDRAYYELGQLAYALYGRGEINQSGLQTACNRLQALHQEIEAKEQMIDQIREEVYVDPLPQGLDQAKLVCPNGHGPLVANARFCQTCGAEGIRPNKQAVEGVCRHCGTKIQPDAKFCASCGQPVASVEVAASSEIIVPPASCVNCGAELLPNADFCAECGTRVAVLEAVPDPSPAQVASEPSVEWSPFATDQTTSEESEEEE